MTQKLVLTSDWSLDQLMVYSPQITACLKKLREKFPDDGTMDSYAHDMMTGGLMLWIMFEDDEFKGIVLTMIKVVDATGFRSLVVAGLAGEDGVELAHNIETLEEWAREQDLDAITPVGRKGWERPLKKIGYEVERVTYIKRLK